MELRYAIPLLVLFLGMGFVSAATTYSTNVQFSVTVPEFIDVTVSPGTISLPSINPTENGTATTPVVVTNTANSNVPITISVNGSNFANGNNSITITNLRMRANSAMPAASDFVNPHFINTTMQACSASLYSLGQNCYNIPVNSNVNLWFNLYVPGGTIAGAYTTSLTIKADRA